jgi:Zn-dependent protease with chaperone function
MNDITDHRADLAPLDRFAIDNPRRYRLHVALLAVLGFATLGGSFLLALGLAAGMLVLVAYGKAVAVLLKLAILPLGLAWSILKSLFVRIEAPEGIALRPGEAPALEQEVERLRVATGAPRLSAIVITDDFNAAAASVPRLLGLFGHRHILVLGLPLMEALDREQFAAVVAHEFGHFGGGHSRFAGWIYRVRASWLRVRGILDEQHGWLGLPLRRFFDWYAPYFGRYSFALARQSEFEADAAAARIVGAEPAARALVSTALGARRLQDFWRGLWAQVGDQPTPPADVHARMAQGLRLAAPDEDERLAQALRETAIEEDTHPPLAQRLRALGCTAALPQAPTDSAASLLGEHGVELAGLLSRQWSDAAGANWRRQHALLQGQKQRLHELGAKEPASRSPDEHVEFACLRDELDDGDDVVAALLAASELVPANAEVQYRLGRRALDEGDGRGVGAIEAAMRLDPGMVHGGLLRLGAWFDQQGDADARARIVARLEALEQERGRAMEQRRRLRPGDRFRRHGLDDERLRVLQAAVRAFGKVGKAWLARKELAREDGQPHYVVALTWRTLAMTGDATLQKFADMLPLDGTWTVVLADSLGASKKDYFAAAGEPVYPAR